jgi:D-glycero-D-manno-heptose 1,7-bisphosphate phosphatase
MSIRAKAVFLDRDGVINYDDGHTYRIEDFHLMDGVIDALRYFQESGYLLVVITNQAGIAKGLYTEEDFFKLNQYMLDLFMELGININGVYFCPHHPNGVVEKYIQECACRKPQPGMILKAIEELNIDPKHSILIGDKESDIEAGVNSGIPRERMFLFDGVQLNFSAIAKACAILM